MMHVRRCMCDGGWRKTSEGLMTRSSHLTQHPRAIEEVAEGESVTRWPRDAAELRGREEHHVRDPEGTLLVEAQRGEERVDVVLSNDEVARIACAEQGAA